MNRVAKCCAVMLLALSLTLPISNIKPQKAHALADVDQTCQYGTSPEQITYLSHEPVQVFIPTKNRLEAVQVYVKAAIGTEANIRMEVQSENHGVIAARTERVTNQWTWQLFEFPDIEMPMDIYGIALTDSGDLGKSVWMHGPSGCYDRGYAIYDNTAHMEFDYRFAINAHDADNPSNSSSNNQSSSSNTSGTSSVGTTRGTGSAPASSTSSSIAAPTNLVAANESNYTGTGIRLNWTQSTTENIDGYKIFRSNSESSGFVEVGRTIKGVGVYLDSTVSLGQTYYYFIRAYKGNSESASSNIANAKPDDTFAKDLANSADNSGGIFGGGLLFVLARFLIPLIFFGLIFILFIVGIILLVRNRRKNQASQPSETESPQKTQDKKSK